MAQLTGIHPIKVGGILEIATHVNPFCSKNTHYYIYKQTISAKSENCEAISEIKASKSRRTFAV
ncbi:MAG: hypothetical protein Q4E32_09585 [Bacteroidales bacterium]|nr:hypothetical protein [Bacteroidales bacterium]